MRVKQRREAAKSESSTPFKTHIIDDNNQTFGEAEESDDYDGLKRLEQIAGIRPIDSMNDIDRTRV